MFELTERLRMLEESIATAHDLVRKNRMHKYRHRWSEEERRRRDLLLVELLRPLVCELEDRIEALAVAAEDGAA